MTKIVTKVFIIMLFVFSKPLVAQTVSTFEQEHAKLLSDYVAFIDSTEKKQPFGSYFQIHKHKHISFVEFKDDKLVYRIAKKVKVYKSGVRYEKIDWSIRYPNKRWYHKIYEIKQVGANYRFIEQINYEFGKKLIPTKITTSIDDNYLRIKIVSPDDKRATYLYVKPGSSLPLTHQN
ncbi:MAG: hypothetical protein ABI388_00710 [Bacteroidia bacterium]